ncbi:hypothetical protein BANRA_00266 [Klebsiella variicola]|nr:hypothetical protein BANRA_00266 [Klebsiella variicola]
MRGAACFDTNKTGFEPGEKGEHPGAMQGFAKHNTFLVINRMKLKNLFCEIEANTFNIHVDTSPWELKLTPQSGTLMP